MTEEYRTLPAAEALCPFHDGAHTLNDCPSRPIESIKASQHVAHCNQGEHVGSCKYGPNEWCPVLMVLDAFLALPVADVGDEELRELRQELHEVLGDHPENKTALYPEHNEERYEDCTECQKRYALNARPAPAQTGLREALQSAHDRMDNVNASTTRAECVWCRAEGYDGDGLKHTEDCIIVVCRAALADEQGAAGEANDAEERARRYMYALENIIVRCTEGDKRTDWLPTIASIARAALAPQEGAQV